MLTDVAQLPGEGCRGVAGRQSHQLDQRRALQLARRAVGKDRLEAGDRLCVPCPLGDPAVVDQLVQRAKRRVLVGDPGQQELLETMGRGLRNGAAAREFLGESIQKADAVGAQPGSELGHGGAHGARPPARLVARDQQVADLMEQAHRADLAGLDGRRAACSIKVHPGGQAADPRRIRDDQIAPRPDQCSTDRVPFPRFAAEVKVASHGPSCRPGGTRSATAAATVAASSAARSRVVETVWLTPTLKDSPIASVSGQLSSNPEPW